MRTAGEGAIAKFHIKRDTTFALEQTLKLAGHAATFAVKGIAGIVFGAVGEIGAIAFDLLWGGDILLPTRGGGSEFERIVDQRAVMSRTVPAHEYGHFALCNLLEARSPSLFSSAYNEAAAEGILGQTPDKEPVVLNEAFADFMTGQLAGGIDYSINLSGLLFPIEMALLTSSWVSG